MKNSRLIGICNILMCGSILLVACNRSTNEINLNKIETSSFTDSRDGKIYRTVKIGDQWIMAENFAYKPDKGNFWAYENNENNMTKYGYLYDWETANNIAPEGWHLPSGDEFIDIRKALGCKRSLITYLEEIYPKLINGGSSGLNMLLAGMRTCDGEFRYMGDKARFWTSTSSSLKIAGHFETTVYGLDSNKDSIPHGLRKSTAPMMFQNREFSEKCQGFSVRLFKD